MSDLSSFRNCFRQSRLAAAGKSGTEGGAQVGDRGGVVGGARGGGGGGGGGRGGRGREGGGERGSEPPVARFSSSTLPPARSLTRPRFLLFSP